MERARDRRTGVELQDSENQRIKKKMENVLPIKNKSIRKKQKSKISTLKTYVDLKIKERKEYLEGDTSSALRGKTKIIKPKSMKGRRIKSPPVKDLAVATKQLSSMIRTGLPLLEALKIISDTTENVSIKYVFREIALGISKGLTI